MWWPSYVPVDNGGLCTTTFTVHPFVWHDLNYEYATPQTPVRTWNKAALNNLIAGLGMKGA